MGGHEVIDSRDALDAVLDTLSTESLYALDTEFHRERTYYPKLALVQIAWRGGLALIDPLAVDLEPLTRLLRGDAIAVVHAADQDLEVLELACGTVPTQLFDTQVAAGFVGMSSPSLATLYERALGIRVPKADRLSDWLARPLSATQLDYAAADVAHLLEVHDKLVEQLDERGRLGWAEAECEQVRRRARGTRDPDDAWRRIKEARQLKGRAHAVVQAVAAWREQRAAALDVPPRYVMPDLAVVTIAQRPPRSADDLQKVRGLDDRHLRGQQADQLLAAIADALQRPAERRDDQPPRDLERELRPAVGLVAAWVSQLARNLEIDAALLATRADLESLLRGDVDARLAEGWRAEIVGEPVRRLVAGEAALAFNGKGELVLEERSHRPIV
jgi:ribonuclease D